MASNPLERTGEVRARLMVACLGLASTTSNDMRQRYDAYRRAKLDRGGAAAAVLPFVRFAFLTAARARPGFATDNASLVFDMMRLGDAGGDIEEEDEEEEGAAAKTGTIDPVRVRRRGFCLYATALGLAPKYEGGADAVYSALEPAARQAATASPSSLVSPALSASSEDAGLTLGSFDAYVAALDAQHRAAEEHWPTFAKDNGLDAAAEQLLFAARGVADVSDSPPNLGCRVALTSNFLCIRTAVLKKGRRIPLRQLQRCLGHRGGGVANLGGELIGLKLYASPATAAAAAAGGGGGDDNAQLEESVWELRGLRGAIGEVAGKAAAAGGRFLSSALSHMGARDAAASVKRAGGGGTKQADDAASVRERDVRLLIAVVNELREAHAIAHAFVPRGHADLSAVDDHNDRLAPAGASTGAGAAQPGSLAAMAAGVDEATRRLVANAVVSEVITAAHCAFALNAIAGVSAVDECHERGLGGTDGAKERPSRVAAVLRLCGGPGGGDGTPAQRVRFAAEVMGRVTGVQAAVAQSSSLVGRWLPRLDAADGGSAAAAAGKQAAAPLDVDPELDHALLRPAAALAVRDEAFSVGRFTTNVKRFRAQLDPYFVFAESVGWLIGWHQPLASLLGALMALSLSYYDRVSSLPLILIALHGLFVLAHRLDPDLFYDHGGAAAAAARQAAASDSDDDDDNVGGGGAGSSSSSPKSAGVRNRRAEGKQKKEGDKQHRRASRLAKEAGKVAAAPFALGGFFASKIRELRTDVKSTHRGLESLQNAVGRWNDRLDRIDGLYRFRVERASRIFVFYHVVAAAALAFIPLRWLWAALVLDTFTLRFQPRGSAMQRLIASVPPSTPPTVAGAGET